MSSLKKKNSIDETEEEEEQEEQEEENEEEEEEEHTTTKENGDKLRINSNVHQYRSSKSPSSHQGKNEEMSSVKQELNKYIEDLNSQITDDEYHPGIFTLGKARWLIKRSLLEIEKKKDTMVWLEFLVKVTYAGSFSFSFSFSLFDSFINLFVYSSISLFTLLFFTFFFVLLFTFLFLLFVLFLFFFLFFSFFFFFFFFLFLREGIYCLGFPFPRWFFVISNLFLAFAIIYHYWFLWTTFETENETFFAFAYVFLAQNEYDLHNSVSVVS